jgi:hypothetical protein
MELDELNHSAPDAGRVTAAEAPPGLRRVVSSTAPFYLPPK